MSEHLSEHHRTDRRPVDRFYLVAIIIYALLTAGFIAFFIWWLATH